MWKLFFFAQKALNMKEDYDNDDNDDVDFMTFFKRFYLPFENPPRGKITTFFVGTIQ